eukprot:TRINITY_DN6405_c0_g2_i2.p1 TRINITY_DN6405_c0_g2~~TRINITY_DN6405_c0_g2_i2.p1  ORF type:complete len:351 (-),score=68.73 TRINITY_DN6405_c0_g2_i2:34-1014(-)
MGQFNYPTMFRKFMPTIINAYRAGPKTAPNVTSLLEPRQLDILLTEIYFEALDFQLEESSSEQAWNQPSPLSYANSERIHFVADHFQEYICEFMLKRFGFQKEAEHAMLQLLVSVVKYAPSNPYVELFARFSGVYEQLDASCVALYLHALRFFYMQTEPQDRPVYVPETGVFWVAASAAQALCHRVFESFPNGASHTQIIQLKLGKMIKQEGDEAKLPVPSVRMHGLLSDVTVQWGHLLEERRNHIQSLLGHTSISTVQEFQLAVAPLDPRNSFTERLLLQMVREALFDTITEAENLTLQKKIATPSIIKTMVDHGFLTYYGLSLR